MGIEIERKFLVVNDSWMRDGDGVACRQGYMTFAGELSLRVRIMGDKGALNIKKKRSDIERTEYEYPIPLEDAHEMLRDLCGDRIVVKTRYQIDFKGKTWEVDVFQEANQGLIVAEIELDVVDEAFEKPPWVGEEVSHDPRYLNVSLAQTPYKDW